MNTRHILGAIALILATHNVSAGQVNNLTTFTPHTPAKADDVNANFNAVKSAVDDNNARINANTSDIANHETRIQAVEAGGVAGTLLTQLRGNITVPVSATGYTGYIAVAPRETSTAETLQSYVPPVKARAFVQTRCSFDGNAAGQVLEHRVAIRDSAGVHVGAQYYLRSRTSLADTSIQDVNSDYFDLTPGISYDFGVNFVNPTPKGGVNGDYCSAVVMIFRR